MIKQGKAEQSAFTHALISIAIGSIVGMCYMINNRVKMLEQQIVLLQKMVQEKK